MKAVISKEDVRNARNVLLAKRTSPDQRQPGPKMIHTHLGQGSLTTITKFLRELEAETPRPENQPELQEAFRKFWEIATKAGREQAESQIRELNETQLGLIEENDRLQAELQTAQERAVELEKSQAGLTQDLRNALDAADKARATGESHAGKFADALERIERLQAEHAAALKNQREKADQSVAEVEDRIQKLQKDLVAEQAEHARRHEAAQKKIHELEVALARAETKLESVSKKA